MPRLVSPIDDRRQLELRFERQGDRYSHAVFLVEDNQSRCLIRSRESDDQTIWPLSPPLQQLSVEDRETGPVALLVGMAGRSHWSLAVEVMDDGGFHFDAACQLSGDVEQGDADGRLGSTYELPDPHGVEVTPVKGLLVSAEANTCQAVPQPSHERQLRWTYGIRLPV